MGIFSFVGDIAKSVVGGLFGGKKDNKGGSSGPMESPSTTVANIRSLGTSKTNPVDTTKSTFKAAKQVPMTDFNPDIANKRSSMTDPWQPTKDWYKDLGGEDDLDINDLVL